MRWSPHPASLNGVNAPEWREEDTNRCAISSKYGYSAPVPESGTLPDGTMILINHDCREENGHLIDSDI